jgi:hypothetical protein
MQPFDIKSINACVMYAAARHKTTGLRFHCNRLILNQINAAVKRLVPGGAALARAYEQPFDIKSINACVM